MLAWAICTSVAGPAWGAPPQSLADAAGAPKASGISSIRLERNCNGCGAGSVVVLQRDGLLIYTVTGSARQGTADRVSRATIASRDFDALARLALACGFFGWNDVYEEPQIRDGPWASTSIVRDGREKQVFRRDDAGPPALHDLEDAIDALRAKSPLVPDR